jgi:hypothetical protein
MPDESPKPLSLPLRRAKAVRAAWKPVLANWLLPGAGYWLLGEKLRAKALFVIWAVFLALAWMQLTVGAVEGVRGGVYVPQLAPLAWLPTLGALGTLGAGPAYAPFAWVFGGAGTEPVRSLTQEYGASYLMVAGLLNWLCIFDIFDRATGRWVWRLPADEREGLAERQP